MRFDNLYNRSMFSRTLAISDKLSQASKLELLLDPDLWLEAELLDWLFGVSGAGFSARSLSRPPMIECAFTAQ